MNGERVVIVGGGAAGFFAAITCAQSRGDREVVLLERSSQFLSKVRISGGGRCNVTHAPADARSFSARYPRGARALIGALHRFSPENTVAWFERHGVRLKTEADGRMFPVTDSSATVIDCLMFEAKTAGVRLFARKGLERVARNESGGFDLELSDGGAMSCDRLLLALGGARATRVAELVHSLGHQIESPVPSLFSFHIATPWLRSLPGVSLADVELILEEKKLRERGPLLITHEGVSGPAVLRLSAWGARVLAACDYKFPLTINWLPAISEAALTDELRARRLSQPKKRVMSTPINPLPARLWEQLVQTAGIAPETIWTNLPRANGQALVRQLLRSEMPVDGQSLNKDEFVTCGGVRLPEVNFKTMESRLVPHLYFAGELLDIDGITGGFNFQSAWTTGCIAGRAMAE